MHPNQIGHRAVDLERHRGYSAPFKIRKKREVKFVAKISIPERYQAGVFKIHGLNLETVKAIKIALDNVVHNVPKTPEERPNPAAVASVALESASPTTTRDDLRTIAEALVSMYAVADRGDIPLDEFAEGVTDALISLPNPDFKIPEEDREAFKIKLRILLDADLFAIVAKVDELRTENERIFCHARIVTDLRPVFAKDIEKGPVAMLIEHHLKIAFHEAGRKNDHEFFISLDAEDLQELRQLIDRAEQKAKTLGTAVPGIRLYGLKE